jgi:outer membrane protein assembly factor BamB
VRCRGAGSLCAACCVARLCVLGGTTRCPKLFHVKHCPPGDGWARRSSILRLPRLVLLPLAVLLLGTASACYSVASPQGWADPVFDGNAIYYTRNPGKLEAYDRSAQRLLWEFPTSQMKNVKLEGIYSTPVVDGQTLYTAAYNGSVYALDSMTGQPRWAFPTGSPIIGGILLKDGVLYAGNSDGHVLAIQASDGKKLWQQTAGRRVWSTPVEAGGLIVVTSMDSDVYAFTTQGALAWKSTAASAAVASTPKVDASQLTFGGFDKRYHAINGSNGDAVWSSPPAGNWFWTQGLLSGDNLYAGNLDGHVYAYDATNGSVKWSADLGSPIRSAPVLTQGALLVAARDGKIHGLDPTTGQDKWPAIDAGGSILANLISGQGNAVYAATQPTGKTAARLLQIDPTTGSSSNVITP